MPGTDQPDEDHFFDETETAVFKAGIFVNRITIFIIRAEGTTPQDVYSAKLALFACFKNVTSK